MVNSDAKGHKILQMNYFWKDTLNHYWVDATGCYEYDVQLLKVYCFSKPK